MARYRWTRTVPFVYTPASNYSGSDSFQYKASDGSLQSAVATVSVSVDPVNDKPVTLVDSYITQEDGALVVRAPGVLDNDSDIDSSSLSAVLISEPANGAVSLNSDGSFSYTPAKNFSGTDTFTYKAHDGQTTSSRTKVEIDVAPINDKPSAKDDAYTVREDQSLIIAAPGVLENDSDIDSSSLSANLVSGPSSGVLTLKLNGGLTYTPHKNFHGADSFTYKVSDGYLLSRLATVEITVSKVGDPPVAVSDKIDVIQGESVSILRTGKASVLENDSSVESGQLTAVLKQKPGHGTITLNGDGTFTYVHDGTQSWTDSFTYVARQSGLSSNVATLKITVTPVLDFTFSHQVGIAGLQPPCSSRTLNVPKGTIVQHCYTLRNTGKVPLLLHTLTDSRLGKLLNGKRKRVAPGGEYTHVVTETATSNLASSATWTASNDTLPAASGDPPLSTSGTESPNALSKSQSADITITVSKAADDSDNDTIPDNIEGAGDIDGDNIPNFLDRNAGGDGVNDKNEAGPDPRNPRDSNGDGVPDYLDPSTPGNDDGTSSVYLPVLNAENRSAPQAARQKAKSDLITPSIYVPLIIR